MLGAFAESFYLGGMRADRFPWIGIIAGGLALGALSVFFGELELPAAPAFGCIGGMIAGFLIGSLFPVLRAGFVAEVYGPFLAVGMLVGSPLGGMLGFAGGLVWLKLKRSKAIRHSDGEMTVQNVPPASPPEPGSTR